MLLTDSHTHATHPRSGVLAVRNVFLWAEKAGPTSSDLSGDLSGSPFSIGAHPWHLSAYLHHGRTAAQASEALHAYLGQPGLVAIGEAGLDRVQGPSLAIQQEWFEMQAIAAEQAGLPLIVHCVRTGSDLLGVRRQLGAKQPWLWHGFRGNAIQAGQWMAQGGRLSFGAALLHEKSDLGSIFAELPPEALLLESDDRPELLARIYERAAALRQTTTEQLARQVQQNFAAFYRINHHSLTINH